MKLWSVPVSGFQWQRGQRHGMQLMQLVPVDPDPDYDVRLYPLSLLSADESGGLFRNFAAAEPTPDGFLKFANEFGPLYEIGEGLGKWQACHWDMKRLVTLWDAILTLDTKTLSTYIHWHPQYRHVSYFYAKADNPIAIADPEEQYRDWWAIFSRDDVVQPALCLVHDIVNSYLTPNVSPKLIHNIEMSESSLDYAASNLAGAIWLEAAKALALHTRQDYCRHCGRWFDVPLGKTKLYCSPSHKNLAFLERKKNKAKTKAQRKDKHQ